MNDENDDENEMKRIAGFYFISLSACVFNFLCLVWFFFKRILLSIFWSMWVKEGSQKKTLMLCFGLFYLCVFVNGTCRDMKSFFSLTLIHQWATFAHTTWLNNVLRPNIWKKRYGKTKGSLIFYVLCLCVSGSNSFICIQRIGVDWRPNTQMPS